MEKLYTFIVDIDDTILTTPLKENGKYDYDNSEPIFPVISKLQELRHAGHTIILFTARGMKTYQGDVERIEEVHRDRLEGFIQRWNVPCDNLIFGKPWGSNPIYLDNRNLSLSSFLLSKPNNFESLIKEENAI